MAPLSPERDLLGKDKNVFLRIGKFSPGKFFTASPCAAPGTVRYSRGEVEKTFSGELILLSKISLNSSLSQLA